MDSDTIQRNYCFSTLNQRAKEELEYIQHEAENNQNEEHEGFFILKASKKHLNPRYGSEKQLERFLEKEEEQNSVESPHSPNSPSPPILTEEEIRCLPDVPPAELANSDELTEKRALYENCLKKGETCNFSVAESNNAVLNDRERARREYQETMENLFSRSQGPSDDFRDNSEFPQYTTLPNPSFSSTKHSTASFLEADSIRFSSQKAKNRHWASQQFHVRPLTAAEFSDTRYASKTNGADVGLLTTADQHLLQLRNQEKQIASQLGVTRESAFVSRTAEGGSVARPVLLSETAADEFTPKPAPFSLHSCGHKKPQEKTGTLPSADGSDSFDEAMEAFRSHYSHQTTGKVYSTFRRNALSIDMCQSLRQGLRSRERKLVNDVAQNEVEKISKLLQNNTDWYGKRDRTAFTKGRQMTFSSSKARSAKLKNQMELLQSLRSVVDRQSEDWGESTLL